MKSNEPKTMEEAIEATLQQAIKAARFYISQGISREQAIQMIRDNSCFGVKTWERFLSSI